MWDDLGSMLCMKLLTNATKHVQHQAITSVNIDPDLCLHMASLGHNELNSWGWDKIYAVYK